MSRFVRREFLRALVVVAGPRLLAGCGDDSSGAPSAVNYFPQSVASGDPRATSVVLWTRVVDPAAVASDQTLELVVATDEALKNVVELQGGGAYPIVAQAVAGGCVKVRVEGLAPSTTYYYRFTFVQGGERRTSRTGRTRTAPDPDADTPVSFAVVSCQDFGGKYYHAYRHLAEREVDFVLHLGDYIYETLDDPSFQSSSPDRRVKFSAPGEALVVDKSATLGMASGAAPVLAARSLGNYRDLYRTYRADPDLQRVHELFPIVAIPDDHEFSDDCYGASGTYTNDRENEEDFARRRAADQAWFEYMPVDYSEPPASALDPTATFPDDFRVYRSFVFGRHVELVLSDLRRYRPDHVVPESAFPGAVFMTDVEAKTLLGTVPDDLVATVSIDGDDVADVRAALLAVADASGFEAEAITGLLSVPWINQTLVAAGEDAPLDETDSAYGRGYAFHQLLKVAQFSEQGSRYIVAERPFRAYAQKRIAETDGASERLMGDEQRAWFTSTLAASTRTWKVWANEYGLMRRAIDLTGVTLAPDEFRQRLLLTAEDWDGAPNERNALLTDLAGVENLVVVTGDLHAFFAGTPYAEDDVDTRVIELIAGSITSATWLATIKAVIADNPALPPGVAFLAELVGSLLTDTDTRANPHIGWLDLESNGYAVVAASPDALSMTTFALPATLVTLAPNALPAPLDTLVTATEFRVQSGTRELEQLFGAAWKRWDRDSMSWV